MKDDFKLSRYEKRNKKRKTNIILNSLIAMVFLLIVIVSYNIFFSSNEPASGTDESAAEQSAEENKPSPGEKKQESNAGGEQQALNDEKKDKEESSSRDEENKPINEDDEVIREEGDRPNVVETIVNPNWDSIGTSQTGEHVTVYSSSHVDWEEMVQAISYAVGIPEDEFTIHFLGNNGPNKSAGTIYRKSNKEEIYKVYIEWVDGRGWKPTKVEVLSSLER